MMKKRIIAILALLLAFQGLRAQSGNTAALLDSLPVYEPLPNMDLSYSGKNILDELAKSSLTSGTVNIEQSAAVKAALSARCCNSSTNVFCRIRQAATR